METDRVDEIVAAWRQELPAVAGLSLELAKRAGRLSDLFAAATEPVLAGHQVTKVEYGVLATLRATGEPFRLKPTRLSGSLLVTTGGLSNVLLRLVEARLVTREADPDDRRSRWVQLTHSGVRLAETLVTQVQAAQAAVLAPVDDATARAAADALRDVLLAVEGPHAPAAVRNPASA